jgi:hypothetical protein
VKGLGFPPLRRKDETQVPFGSLRAGFRLVTLAQNDGKDGFLLDWVAIDPSLK